MCPQTFGYVVCTNILTYLIGTYCVAACPVTDASSFTITGGEKKDFNMTVIPRVNLLVVACARKCSVIRNRSSSETKLHCLLTT